METPEIKSPRDKLLDTINTMDEMQYNLPFIDILMTHVERNPTDFGASDLLYIVVRLEQALALKLADLEMIADVAEERAGYLKNFLEGKTYTSEEAAKQHLPVQISNVDDILNECKRRWE